MNCSRCHGLLGAGYDDMERMRYWYCLNCGHRPMQQSCRADGLGRCDPLLCSKCGKAPRALLRRGYRSAEADEGVLCDECRSKRKAQYLRRKAKKRKEREAA